MISNGVEGNFLKNNNLTDGIFCENQKKEQEPTNLEDFSKNEETKNNNFVIISEEISDYEKLRLKNIKEKNKFLKNSKLIEKVSSVKWGIQKWESESTNEAVNSSQIRSIKKSKFVKLEPFKTRVMPKRCKRKPLKYRDKNSTNYYLIKEKTKICDNTDKTPSERPLKNCDENPMEYDFVKGQLISKCLFGVFNSLKKRTKTIRLYYYGTSSRIIFVRFLGELKTPKRHFEIN